MTNMTQTASLLDITTPDDWHLHFRDGDALRHTVPATARCFARAIVMPNLVPPVTTVAQAEAYRERILAQVPAGVKFEPLMVLYLTDQTSVEEPRRCHQPVCLRLQAVSGRRHYEFLQRCERSVGSVSVAGGNGKSRSAAAGARRSDRKRDRYFRSRESLYRSSSGTDYPPVSWPASGVRTHHHGRCGGIRAGVTGERGRHHHTTTPDA